MTEAQAQLPPKDAEQGTRLLEDKEAVQALNAGSDPAKVSRMSI